jgi:hypothetical protein
MLTKYVTEGSLDRYHVRLNCANLIEKRNSEIRSIKAEVKEGQSVAQVALAILDSNKIDLHIRGLMQGIALIHVYIEFFDSTIETFCMHHRGVNC